MEMSMDVFQKKNYEKDLLDQEKEREELLFLEMEQFEKEKHQNEGKSSSEKSFEKKRRDPRTPTQSLPKNIPISVPGPSSTPSTSKDSFCFMIHIMFVLKDKLRFYLLLDYIYMISEVSFHLFLIVKTKMKIYSMWLPWKEE